MFLGRDILFSISLDPQAGHGQKGRRPVIVVSNDEYSLYTNFCRVYPITNTDRNYPLHIGEIQAWNAKKQQVLL